MTATAVVHPSLAVVKYWGKQDTGVNLPATSSLAISLRAFHTRTSVNGRTNGDPDEDEIVVNDQVQDLARFRPVIDGVRSRAAQPGIVRVTSTNNFPTAAGLASSSSGLAALTLALDGYFGTRFTPDELSAVARLGSGSAARAVFGGFTEWRAGAASASRLAEADNWPDLRILIAVVRTEKKSVSSREAMRNSRATSPYYENWVDSSATLFDEARSALLARDLERLGSCMRRSYLRMFSTMFTSDPPLIYWLPQSLAIIRCCDTLRSRGIGVWETMDAGPQVKMVLLEHDLPAAREALLQNVAGIELIESSVGGDPVVHVEN